MAEKSVLRTEICEMLGIEYPLFLAGMGAMPSMQCIGEYYTETSLELVAAVSMLSGTIRILKGGVLQGVTIVQK